MRGDRTKPYFGVPASTSPPTGQVSQGSLGHRRSRHVPSGRATPRSISCLRHGRRDDRGPRGVHARHGRSSSRRPSASTTPRPSTSSPSSPPARSVGPGRPSRTAVVAFLVYDVLFTDPRLSPVDRGSAASCWTSSSSCSSPWSSVASSPIQRARGADATRRAAEANSLFALSRALATAPSTVDAAPDVAERLRADLALERVRIHAGETGPGSVIADTAPGDAVLDAQSRDVAGPDPGRRAGSLGADPCADGSRYRRPDGRHRPPRPDRARRCAPRRPDRAARAGIAAIRTAATTRILALAADQLAISLRRDALRQMRDRAGGRSPG